MLIKTFEGLSVPDAMKAVKKELGPDAVILSTKEKFQENGKLKTVEVKAATHMKSFTDDREHGDDKVHFRLDRLEYLNEKILEKINYDFFYEKMFDHLREIKLILSSNKINESDQNFPSKMAQLYEILYLNGIEKDYLFEIFQFLKNVEEEKKEEIGHFSSIEEFYRSESISWMLKKIKIFSPDKDLKGKTQIHLFIGPSGSGKTTLVQKLSSYLKTKQKSVLLVSFDTLKVGGNEPLRIYSKILGCEYKTLESAKDLHNLVLEYRNIDYIIVDSLGKNPKCYSDLDELKDFKSLDLPILFHLVLSILEKNLELNRAIHYFGKVGLDSLSFSRLDSSMAFGDLFNLSYKWSIPLNYFSTGQKIPDHFEKASKERIIEKIFGL
jgi:flagellar biosynthesis protein FlhF